MHGIFTRAFVRFHTAWNSAHSFHCIPYMFYLNTTLAPQTGHITQNGRCMICKYTNAMLQFAVLNDGGYILQLCIINVTTLLLLYKDYVSVNFTIIVCQVDHLICCSQLQSNVL